MGKTFDLKSETCVEGVIMGLCGSKIYDKELQFCMASVDKLHVCMTDYEILSDGLVDFYFPYADGKTFFDISTRHHFAKV